MCTNVRVVILSNAKQKPSKTEYLNVNKNGNIIFIINLI